MSHLSYIHKMVLLGLHCTTWVKPTLCLSSLNELVKKLPKSQQIELAGEAFQYKELKSSLRTKEKRKSEEKNTKSREIYKE